MQISPALFRGWESPVSGSTIFISAFLTTVPHAPDLISKGSFAKAKHIAITGPASVIPYPYAYKLGVRKWENEELHILVID
jgi:hypothetical protein